MHPVDAKVGYWIRDEVYTFDFSDGYNAEEDDEDDYEHGKREYNISGNALYKRPTGEMTKLKHCGSDGWVSRYFQWEAYKGNDAFRKNGRISYFTDGTATKFEIQQQIPALEKSPLARLLNPFKDDVYDISSLICAQFATAKEKMGWDALLEKIKKCPAVSECDPCTKIGYKIAKSLIRIASLRIFADPEQSIIELPVNSLDAYNPSQKVGKFGMGFFSILYWLVGHPKRKLLLSSFTKDTNGKYITYDVTIQEINGLLAFRLVTYPESEIIDTGFRVSMDCYNDPFTNVQLVNFGKQLNKLTYATGATIYQNTSYASKPSIPGEGWWSAFFGKPSPFNGPVKDSDRDKNIFSQISPEGFIIEDYATGVPPEVVFGSLFVPSISTKTIRLADAVILGDPSARTFIVRKTLGLSNFRILISGIIVVDIEAKPEDFSTADDYVIEMPRTTRIPVSRDDIILSTQQSGEIFRYALVNLLTTAGRDMRDVSALQGLLSKYIDYTASIETKNIVARAMTEYFNQNRKVLVPGKYASIYNSLQVQSPFIFSKRYDPTSVEETLDATIESADDVWHNIKVVYTNLGKQNISSGGLIRYLFIDKKYKKQLGEGWVQTITTSYMKTKLYPVDASSTKPDFLKYENVQIRVTYQANPDSQNVPLFIGKSKINKIETLVEINDTAKNIIDDPATLSYYYSLLSRYESLSIYFHLDGWTLFATILMYCYAMLGKDAFHAIISACFAKFNSFIGNQTYGGQKYKLKVPHPDIEITRMYLRFKSDKVDAFLLEGIIATINAIEEDMETNLVLLTENNVINYRQPSLGLPVISPRVGLMNITSGQPIPTFSSLFKTTAYEVSKNMADYTYLMAGLGHGLTNEPLPADTEIEASMRGLINASLEQFHATGRHDSLTSMFKIWKNRYYSTPFISTYIYLMQQTDVARGWMQTINRAKSLLPYDNAFENLGLPINPQVSLSNLITTLFETNLPATDKEFLTMIRGIKPEAVDNPLQIIEIATNEGTTKPFIDATLTELTQNSIDAIRLSTTTAATTNVGKDIAINLRYLKSDPNTLVLQITDYVGIPYEGFVYVGIPFLSTKTPSELATGEMGSGFFNAYRESSRVVVETIRDNTLRYSKDTPVLANNRVVDIQKEISITGKVALSNRTTISVYIPTTPENKLEKITRVDYVVRNVLALATLPGTLTYQGGPVNIEKMHVADVGKFQIYVTSTRKYKHESYLLTKGVPFNPLYPYLKQYLGEDLSPELIQQNIVVNIVHGGYTPVQTRTRISMPSEVEKDFGLVGMYSVFALAMLRHSEKTLQLNIDHTRSNANAEQLRFTEYNITPEQKDLNIDWIVKYTKFNGQPSIAELINMCINVMKSSPYPKVKAKINKVLATYKSGEVWLDQIVKDIVTDWLIPKNTSKSVGVKKVEKEGKMVNPAKEPDEPTGKNLVKFFKAWINTYWLTAQAAKIPGYYLKGIPKIEVAYSMKRMEFAGTYDQHTNKIFINTYGYDEEHEDDFLKLITTTKTKEWTNSEKLAANKMWNQFFAFQYPATTICHEAEHFRRGTTHGGSSHDAQNISLYPGDPKSAKSFDQCSNGIYNKVLEYDFFNKVMAEFMGVVPGKKGKK